MRFNVFAPALLASAVAFCGLTRQAEAGGAELALLPGSGNVLMHIDLARLRGSAFYKEILSPLLQNPNFQREMNEAKTELGFDPVNDINSLTVLMNPPSGNGDEEALIVVDGKVNRDTLIAKATTEGKATKAAHNGVDLWAAPANEDDMAISFVGGKTLIGKQAFVKEAIDASKGKGSLNATLKGLVDGVNKGGDIWFVANVSDGIRAELAKGNPMAKDLKSVTGSIDFAKGVAVNLAVESTAETAKAMAGMIQQSLKVDPQTEPMMQQMGLLPVVQKLKVEAKGATLNIGLDLDTNDVNKLKMLAGMMGAGMMGGGAAPLETPPAPVAP